MKKKVDRETLDFYIYDMGWEKTMEIFNLTHNQMNNILYSKVLNFNKKIDYKYIEDDTINNNNNIGTLTEEYSKKLENIYINIRRKLLKNNIINSRSNTNEDVLHNYILKMMMNNIIRDEDDIINNVIRNYNKENKKRKRITVEEKYVNSTEDDFINLESIKLLQSKYLVSTI